MLAAKHFDIVIGIDVHIVQPPGPVPPVPIPHPHVAIVLDPFDYLPILGSTVSVNGLPRAQAGSAAISIPPHLPIGGVFVKPPGNEAELLMGSSTVVAEGEPLGYMALPVLGCSDVGAPPPLRLAKPDASGKPPEPKPKGPPIGLMIPGSVVLPIPMGRPVEVGGAPTVSMLALGFRVGLAALGAAFKGLNKLAKQSERMKNYAAKIHRKAARWMDAIDVKPSVRHKVHDAICTMTGHPVDVATGKVLTAAVDLDIPGPLPLVLERKWFSTSSRRGPLGHGWHHGFDLALVEGDDAVAIRLADGRFFAAPRLALGETWFDRREKLELVRDARGYVLRSPDGLAFGFVPKLGERPSPCAWLEDASGNTIALRYDDADRLIEILDSVGRRFPITCDEQGRIVEIRGPHPEREGLVTHVRYVYDRHGDLVEVHDALAQVARWRYVDHLLVQETDRSGLSFHFEWDEQRRCVHTWGDGNIHDHRLAYGEGSTTVTNGLGFSVVLHHDAEGLVHRTIDAAGHASSVERNEHLEVVATTDALGRRTRVSRDPRGNPIEIVAPDGSTQMLVWDERDRLLRSLDVLGSWWQWRWDERGRVLEQLGPEGLHTRMLWQGPRLAGVVSGRSFHTRIDYDAQGNVTSVSAGEQTIARARHDRLGFVVATDRSGAAVQLRRDLLGRVVEQQLPDGNVVTREYDGEGNVVHERDRTGEQRFELSGMGKIVAQHRAGTTLRFRYDSEERLVAFVNEHALEHRFELDGRGDVIAEVGYDGRRTSYERDALGRVVAVVSPGGKRRKHVYNRAGLVAKIEHADGETVELAYRADGALISARNPTAAVTLERDALGRVVREWQGEHWIATTLDRQGKRVRMRTSFGADLRIDRGPFGEWLGLHYRDAQQDGLRWDATIERDAARREIDRHLPGGVRSRWGFDRSGRPFQHQIWDGRAVARNRGYRWGVQNRLEALADAATGTIQFRHDERGFLTWAQSPLGTTLRSPDDVGNVHRSEDHRDRRHGPLGNLLESHDERGRPTKYEWDDEGQLVARDTPEGRWTYHWSAAGKLLRVERPAGPPVEFGYDAFSRRTFKRCGDVITRFVWDGDVLVHEWREAAPSPSGDKPKAKASVDEDATGFVLPAFVAERSAAVVADDEETGYVEPAFVGRKKPDSTEFLRPKPAGLITWIFEPGRFAPAARIAAVALAVLVDHLGTPLMMLDEQGRRAWAAELDVDGALVREEGEAGACPFRFPGQYADEETGLHYNLFRYYDPIAAAYVSADPIGFSGGVRLYAYAFDPLVWLDPLGLAPRTGYDCATLFINNAHEHRKVGVHFPSESLPWTKNAWAVRNRNGGEYWGFSERITSFDAMELIARPDPNQHMLITYGLHGNNAGQYVDLRDTDEILGWYMHKLGEASNDPVWAPYTNNITFVNIAEILQKQDYNTLDEVINFPGRVVGGSCFSTHSIITSCSLFGG